jgi:hypothetical protein
MMKKALALAGAGALLLTMAGPAFGNWWWMGGNDVDIDNHAFVMNDVYTKADSGDNSIGGKYVWGGSIRTGAATAGSTVGNDVNSSFVGCACDKDVDIDNHAFVMNDVYTKADSGDNSIGGKCVGGGTIVTGAAGAGSVVTNFVNWSTIGL